jgi:hypothetical protein
MSLPAGVVDELELRSADLNRGTKKGQKEQI